MLSITLPESNVAYKGLVGEEFSLMNFKTTDVLGYSRSIVSLIALMTISNPALAEKYQILGEQQVWRTLTIDFTGPESSEIAAVNPFADYRLDVVFSKSDKTYEVPGYYAACGQAALNSCDSGNVWRVHFTPDMPGAWKYKVKFVTGEDVATGVDGKKVKGLHNIKGKVDIAPAGDAALDPRDRGRLQYNGTRYLRYAATNEVFFKAGPDAPENMLAYDDFDATPNADPTTAAAQSSPDDAIPDASAAQHSTGLRKSWAAHLRDSKDIDLEKYGWNGKGAGILGAISYIADQGLNSISFLTFNVGGDDRNVFPHLLKVSTEEYSRAASAKGTGFKWSPFVERDRFDVSKMDQWQRTLTYANDRGLFLHFKLQETENDHLMDGGKTGRERTLYLREMIARYSHFLALNWNMGEENNQPAENQKAMAQKIADLDPYNHLRVLHTFPFEKFRYLDLIGDKSAITGLSLQGALDTMEDVRPDTKEWVQRSEASGKPWVISYDEPGHGTGGTPVDKDYPDDKLPQPREFDVSRQFIRENVLWATLTAGGTGVEYYYGYKSGCGDLHCQDQRTRANIWNDSRVALEFMRNHIGAHAERMMVLDGSTSPIGINVFGERGRRYVIYKADSKKFRLFTGVDEGGTFKISWYDPIKGGDFVREQILDTATRGVSGRLEIEKAPYETDQDWVILIERQ